MRMVSWRGQALVEMAFAMPLFLLLVWATLRFSLWVRALIRLNKVAFEANRVESIGGAGGVTAELSLARLKRQGCIEGFSFGVTNQTRKIPEARRYGGFETRIMPLETVETSLTWGFPSGIFASRDRKWMPLHARCILLREPLLREPVR